MPYDIFDYKKERPFYCEKIEKECPFDSRFRYCWDCPDLQELAEDYDADKEEQ